ncbi:aldo/keto reductase [Nocardioides perillae]|uniref:Diketogulonate reductase-like aldo/keto reductase n=1 Tax=Nocardioides perillae TaxID=1119534 RepID=A0A7Y9RWN7_9ACTN|nr:diketogulonate reductase-like aldo/keto reductase [Nocardioides perillae]
MTTAPEPAPSGEPGDPRAALTLLDGSPLPRVGFGTYPLRGEEGTTAMVSALEAGYRLLDTAVNYDNEREVGEALRRSGVPREEVFLTTKVPGRHHAYDDAVASVRGSLERLGVEQLDLVLIHWPNPSRGLYTQAWRALVACREQGLVRHVGVSNFTEEHLALVIEDSGVVPAVNQVELHPRFPQPELRAVHERLGVLTEAWSPLGKRRAPLDEPAVTGPAERLGTTPGQVILGWHLHLGVLPIPKSADPERQRQNLHLDDVALTPEEVDAISALAEPDGRLFGGDPDTHEEM